MVTFQLFARPVIDALAGVSPRKLTFLKARLKAEIKTKTGLTRFLPALLIASMARADCYVVIPPDREKIVAGEWVPVMLR